MNCTLPAVCRNSPGCFALVCPRRNLRVKIIRIEGEFEFELKVNSEATMSGGDGGDGEFFELKVNSQATMSGGDGGDGEFEFTTG